MSHYIRSMPIWPTTTLPDDGLFFFYDPGTDQEYKLVPSQLRTGGPTLQQVDLLELTTEFMDAVMGLAYTDCDADPAASPAGSFPGQQFDAVGADGKNRHYYCTRSTYVPGDPATGVGPAWHRLLKA